MVCYYLPRGTRSRTEASREPLGARISRRMTWIGKFIGAVVGFLVARHWGLVVGLVLGHLFDFYFGRVLILRTRSHARDDFLECTFALLAKLSKADGAVAQEEIEAVERFMMINLGLNRESRSRAIKIFRNAKDSARTFEDYANQFYLMFRSDKQTLVGMIHVLFTVAIADGHVCSSEEAMISHAARIFHLSSEEYRQIRFMYTGASTNVDTQLDRYYAILGCEKGDSDEHIKSRYRKLAQDYHPDKVVSKGLPEEFVRFAKEKFQDIQTAYEKVRESREKLRPHSR
ncbi:MAG: co-chaperone DjlA [Deltaproteobacteria bacterium]|nr:co-chaperone DjlA [Deltaproteobacteria bacterium]